MRLAFGQLVFGWPKNSEVVSYKFDMTTLILVVLNMAQKELRAVPLLGPKCPENQSFLVWFFRVFPKPFLWKTKFPDFHWISRVREVRRSNPAQGTIARAGWRGPAREPARGDFLFKPASRSRVTWCLTCRGAPPPPPRAGLPENQTLGAIARKIHCPKNPFPKIAARKIQAKVCN